METKADMVLRRTAIADPAHSFARPDSSGPVMGHRSYDEACREEDWC